MFKVGMKVKLEVVFAPVGQPIEITQVGLDHVVEAVKGRQVTVRLNIPGAKSHGKRRNFFYDVGDSSASIGSERIVPIVPEI